MKLFAAKFRRILEVLRMQGLQKVSGRIFWIFPSKNYAVCCEVQVHFRSSLPARFTKRFLGAFSRLMRLKTKMSAVKFRQILKVFSMQTLWKISWRNFMINASKNEAVCREVQTHFGSFLHASFVKTFLGIFSRLMRLKTKMSAVKFRQILKVFSIQTLWKSSWCNFTINASKNEAVCHEVQTHFACFLRASFLKTFLGAFSRFLRPQTKLLAVKFRRILEVLRLQGLRRKFCTNFHDLCAPKRSCLLRSSDPIWKFSACKVYRKTFWVHFHNLCV